MDSKIINDKLKILIIEDNPGDVFLIQEMLEDAGTGLFELTHADRLSAGLIHLTEDRFDLILLDLSLPDSHGLDTFKKVHDHAPDVPLVVLTGLLDDAAATQSMRAGAQDYLEKGEINSRLLIRSIRYAIERQGLIQQLEQERDKKKEASEIRFLERIKGSGQTDVTARLFGMGPLRDTLPEVFDDLVERYACLMDKALEKWAYRVDYDISEELRAMGEDLGLMKALPRDVVEVHTDALSKRNCNATAQKAKAYSEEGRYMLLEVMGYLAIYYRSTAIGR